MSYIGNSLTQQSFTGGVDQFNGDASNTAFGLTRTINTVYDVDVYVENVWQRPGVGYNVSANTITFTSAPSAGSNNVVVVYRNFTATSVVPIQGSVTTTSFAANAIPATLGYVPANKAGDTFTGAVIVNNAITSNTLTVSTNTATFGSAVYVVANGSVGVGTNTPGAGIKLDVQGGEIRAGRVDSSSEGGQISLARSSDNATAWYVDVFGNTSTPSLRLVDVSAGAVSLAINSSGAVALRGAGSVSGVGITFPTTQVASSDANTLDDYEEGTWTPVITAATGTITSQSCQGNYVKVGRLVTLTFSAQLLTGTITAVSQITGLPFVINTNTPIGASREWYASGNMWEIIGNNGASTCSLLRYDNSSTCNAQFAWNGTFSYITNN